MYSKTERQLLLYEILYTSHEATIEDLMRRLNASKKTIQRDIDDLTDAGLIKLTYSRKDKSYKHEDTGDLRKLLEEIEAGVRSVGDDEVMKVDALDVSYPLLNMCDKYMTYDWIERAEEVNGEENVCST